MRARKAKPAPLHLTTPIGPELVGMTVSEVLDKLAPSRKIVADDPRSVWLASASHRRSKVEKVVVFFLDTQNKIVGRSTVSVGTLNTTRTHPREIFRDAIARDACGIILVHNHPSGTLRFSDDDVSFTRAISRAGELVGIPLYDHVLVTAEGYQSAKEQGML